VNKFAIITAFLGETRNRYMVPGAFHFWERNAAKTLPYLYSLL
jgi:hypothetical protein